MNGNHLSVSEDKDVQVHSKSTQRIAFASVLCILITFSVIGSGRLDWLIQENLTHMKNSTNDNVSGEIDTANDQTLHSYFSTDYQTARARFVEAARSAGATMSRLPLPELGPNNEELTIDIAWLGNPNPRKVIIHVSGVHGVEGFAGSAIQMKLLEDRPQPPEDGALIFVHTLNPYGMAWLRRYNESNVDLNRNFLFKQSDWLVSSPVYANLDSFLNPPRHRVFDSFLIPAYIKQKKYGLDVLRQAIPAGQNFNHKGLFYCGKHLERGPQLYQNWVKESLTSVEYLLVIDVHTGLGKWGEESLFHKSSATESKLLSDQLERQLLTNYATEGVVAYSFKGGHSEMYQRLAGSFEVDFITQEFGTYPTLYVLNALRDENRYHHLGGRTIGERTKLRLKEAFYPKQLEWKSGVVDYGTSLFSRSVEFVFRQESREQM